MAEWFGWSHQVGEDGHDYSQAREMGADPRSGESHLPGEGVTIISNMRNLDRTIVKVKWQAGGECVVFPEDLGEVRQGY